MKQPHERGPHSGPSPAGFGRGGGRGHHRGNDAEPQSLDGAAGWFAGRLPDEWFEGPVELRADRDELLVVGRIAAPTTNPNPTPDADASPDAEATNADASPDAQAADSAAAEAGRIARFREQTREERMRIAREAEHRFGRKVAWGVQAGDTRQLFTTLAVPVMTRLRQPERQVLDTLVEAGVARSRADALAWCVRLVGRNTDSWLKDLREAMTSVKRVREQGPPV